MQTETYAWVWLMSEKIPKKNEKLEDRNSSKFAEESLFTGKLSDSVKTRTNL